ncbi:hypothetical protein BJ138DRAFT_1183003 [Hygrophoropsis aurantiaca]|uniref:Uncharacterized protein n=1 Tax=Hygrophoropsis aurantiaca TaxID=72124 RepID=A0ACB7ZZL3_9AGAM|nr:hypothetical protein BJ138DRAFT_1183003 [Hygrophoropsis aurantiaca]
MPTSLLALEHALYLVLSSSLASAYSFTFTSQPQQCGTLSLDIQGSGQPPYSVLIIPYGPTPLPNNIEARTIVNQPFSGDSSSVSFQLKFPANSQFVAVTPVVMDSVYSGSGVELILTMRSLCPQVSDSSGFGSGGTSVAATVMGSSDSSCFDATKNVAPDFPFNIYPTNQVVQCNASRLWWDPSEVQGNPTFQGVIPGGDSFAIPSSSITQVANEGTGFSWTPNVRAGSTLLIVAGDNRGLGTGGSEPYNVASGIYPDNSCLSNNSPSSTAGPPAGGSYATNASGSTTGGSGGSSTNVGAIVGGVIGGLAVLLIIALVGLYFIRRRTSSQPHTKERPVDLLQGDPDDDAQSPGELPHYYRPEPFLATAPTEISSAYAQEDGGAGSVYRAGTPSYTYGQGSRYGNSDRRHSGTTSYTDLRSGTTSPDFDAPGVIGAGGASSTGMTSSRKSGMPPRQLRPVNIIQHDDAGAPNEAEEGEGEQPETIELPPAYTNLKKAPS